MINYIKSNPNYKKMNPNSSSKPFKKPQNTNSAINLSNLNMSNAIDYKELTKTLAQYQQSKGLDQSPFPKGNGASISPLKNKSLIDINFLKNAGILSIIYHFFNENKSLYFQKTLKTRVKIKENVQKGLKSV